MKISIARKNLFHEKLRFLISASGVAFSVMLILVLLGLYHGWNEKMTSYIEDIDADVWLLQKGAADMFHSTSLFSNSVQEEVNAVDGVKESHLLLGRPVSFTINDDDEAALVVMGYDSEENVGGPSKVIEGKEMPESGEIVIDEVFANDKDLVVGDVLSIYERDYDIVGISTGGNLVMFQYSFMPIADARELLQMEDITNYLLVTFDEGVIQDDVIADIEETLPDIDVLTKDEFAENNKQIITDSFLPIIYVLVIIGFIVGIIVISLTIYTATIEKAREYGMLKAIGAKNMYLYKVIFSQSSYAGFFGYVLGVAFTYAASATAAEYEPAFVTLIRWQDILAVFGVVIVMILVASYIPIRRIVRIDPAIVFKS